MRNFSPTQIRRAALLAAALLAGCATAPQQPPAVEAAAPKPVPAPSALPAAPASTALVDAPRQVALLLPLSGKLAGAGSQIRDGFFQAYYQAQASGQPVPRVDIVDTGANAQVRPALEQAVQAGAQLVLGPLPKDQVRQLQQGAALPVPTLALNQIEGAAPENLYQFGLNVEDEARQLAALMRPHYSSVLLIRGRDELALRGSQAFGDEWRSRQGTVLQEVVAGDNASGAVREALGLAGAEARRQALEARLQRPLQFNPRPRPEIEAIVLMLRPTQARVLVPTLALFGASRLPLAGTSMLNAGDHSALDAETEGLYLLECPEVLQPSAGAPQSAQDQRLFAMGQDAFGLIGALPALARQPDAAVPGRTGSLSLNAQRQIQRQLQPARFRGGRLQAVDALSP